VAFGLFGQTTGGDETAAVSTIGTPRRDLPSAALNYDRIAARLEAAEAAVFLDYDGVLTPIVSHPDLAVLSDETRAVLTELALVTTVAVVSGRDVDDVMGKIAVPGIYYAGSHGFDIVAPSGQPVEDESLDRFSVYLEPLDRATEMLEARVRDIEGAQVERKRFAIAVHYRRVAADDYARLEGAVTETAPEVPMLRVESGKKIFEFRPDFEWDKGSALEWLLHELGLDGPGVVPLYLGDDTTDEDAFRVIRDYGIGIVVGRDGYPSLASYILADTDEVRLFLSRLVRSLRAKSGELD
jgi:alpha,alpha-trehalase